MPFMARPWRGHGPSVAETHLCGVRGLVTDLPVRRFLVWR